MTIEVKAHHRRILDLAAEDNPTNARVNAYRKSIGYRDSLAQGWIEELPKPAGNGFYFRITPAGAEARYRQTVELAPNPSADAPLSPARYRSAGLRFDLRRTGENQAQFEARINQLAAVADDDGADIGPATDPGRLLGEKSVSAGSLHVDEWRCNAADLADRASIAIFPVVGWWKSTSDKERNNATMRYALVVTIDAGGVELDL